MSSSTLSHRTIIDHHYQTHPEKENPGFKDNAPSRSSKGETSPQSRNAQKKRKMDEADEATGQHRKKARSFDGSNMETDSRLGQSTTTGRSHPPGRKQCRAMIDLVKQLQSKSKTDYFDAPINPLQAPGYHAENSSDETQWGTEVMYFDKMIKKAEAGYYDANPSVRLSRVEYDFNLMIYNAIIYNDQEHPVNGAARKLYQAAQKTLQPWVDGALLCRKCGKDEVFVEDRIWICDYCCEGVHEQCQDVPRPDEQGHHPLRYDSSWFCSESCREKFYKISKKFLLPQESSSLKSDERTKRGGSLPLSYTIEDGQLVLARLGDEAMCPGVISPPTTSDHIREAYKNPNRPMVLWQERGNSATWGFASSYQVIDEKFDFHAYIDNIESVEPTHTGAFVEQLLWAIKNSKFKNTFSKSFLTSIGKRGKRNKKQVYRQHDETDKGAKSASNEDTNADVMDLAANQPDCPRPGTSEARTETDSKMCTTSQRGSELSTSLRADDRHHKKSSGRSEGQVAQKCSRETDSRRGGDDQRRNDRQSLERRSASDVSQPNCDTHDEVHESPNRGTLSNIEKYSLESLLKKIPNLESERDMTRQRADRTGGDSQVSQNTEDSPKVDSSDSTPMHEMIKKPSVRLLPKYEINGKLVGLHCPESESIVGKNTPNSKRCEHKCEHCERTGHQEYECPALFAKVHSRPLPGFNKDGTRNPAQWSGDDILPSNAKEWVDLEEQGYFAYSICQEGTPDCQKMSTAAKEMGSEGGAERQGEEGTARHFEKENGTHRQEEDLDDAMNSSSTTQARTSERTGEESLALDKPSIEAAKGDGSQSTQVDTSAKDNSSQGRLGDSSRPPATDSSDGDKPEGQANAVAQPNTSSGKTPAASSLSSSDTAREGSEERMEIDPEPGTSNAPQLAEGAQSTSETSGESRHAPNASAVQANESDEAAHTSTADTREEASNRQAERSEVQSSARKIEDQDGGAGGSRQAKAAHTAMAEMPATNTTPSYIGVRQIQGGLFCTVAQAGNKWVTMHPFRTAELAARAYDVIVARHHDFQIPPEQKLNFPQDCECTCEVLQIFSEAKQKILQCEVNNEDAFRTSPASSILQAEQERQQKQVGNHPRDDMQGASAMPAGQTAVNSPHPAAATHPTPNPVVKVAAVPLEIQAGGSSRIVHATLVGTTPGQSAVRPVDSRALSFPAQKPIPVRPIPAADARQGSTILQLPTSALAQQQYPAQSRGTSPSSALGRQAGSSPGQGGLQRAASSRAANSSQPNIAPHQALKDASSAEQRARAALVAAGRGFDLNVTIEKFSADQTTRFRNSIDQYVKSLTSKVLAIEQLKNTVGVSLDSSSLTYQLTLMNQLQKALVHCMELQKTYQEAQKEYAKILQHFIQCGQMDDQSADRCLAEINRCKQAFCTSFKVVQSIVRPSQ